ncbi:signal peptidase I [Ruminobacter sp.]|jgi:conjugal transfer pilin signal peptidase TrbI|uniref:signal peptidase I n=1 Tax=Ruminobacter sp. TaxID=2774296 RepID=UPI00386AD53A
MNTTTNKRINVKWAGLAALSLAIGLSVFSYIEDHYNVSFWGHIGADKERQTSCIKDLHYMYITTKIKDYSKHDFQRGGLYTFRSQEGVLFPKGTLFVKYLKGLPGDKLEITENREIKINDVVVASGFPIFERKGITVPEKFFFKEIIPEKKYFFLGDTEHSYDSRYWGYVDEENIVGIAHGFFAADIEQQ